MPGIAVAWVARRSTTSGVADIYVDGVRVTAVDLRSSTTLYRRVVVARAISASVAHRVDVDAFVLLR